MKILFLDVDDVLNCFETKDRVKHADGSLYYILHNVDKAYRGLDKFRLQYLQEIVFKTGSKIVMCSSWRTDSVCMDYLKKRLGKELSNKIIDSTLDSQGRLSRADEIRDWLSKHTDVESFVVLDDSDWNDLDSFGDRWVQTETLKGMDESHRDAVIKKLS